MRGNHRQADSVECPKDAECGVAQTQSLFEYRLEHRRAWPTPRASVSAAATGSCVDDSQDVGGRGFSGERLVTLSLTLGKPTLQIGYDLLGIRVGARISGH